MPSLAQSVTGPVPMVMASQYTNAMTTTKIGMPSQRLVTTRSIFWVVVRPFTDFFTHASATWAMEP